MLAYGNDDYWGPVNQSGTVSNQIVIIPHEWYCASTLTFSSPPDPPGAYARAESKAQVSRDKNRAFLSSLVPRDVLLSRPRTGAPPTPFLSMVHRMRCLARMTRKAPRQPSL